MCIEKTRCTYFIHNVLEALSSIVIYSASTIGRMCFVKQCIFIGFLLMNDTFCGTNNLTKSVSTMFPEYDSVCHVHIY